MSDIITSLPEQFLKEFEDEVLGTVPEEKVRVELRQAANARIMNSVGSLSIPGVGQKIASIDPRLYFRMQAAFGHEENWLRDFLADNPQLCAPGYKPARKHDLRHSKTFVNGVPA